MQILSGPLVTWKVMPANALKMFAAALTVTLCSLGFVLPVAGRQARQTAESSRATVDLAHTAAISPSARQLAQQRSAGPSTGEQSGGLGRLSSGTRALQPWTIGAVTKVQTATDTAPYPPVSSPSQCYAMFAPNHRHSKTPCVHTIRRSPTSSTVLVQPEPHA
jgi:hypothetical protein